MLSKKLQKPFYKRPNVVEIAMDLIGMKLCSRIADGAVTSGIIVETEAYSGRNDKACHANDGRRTDRTEIMYRTGGKAYVYLCYGIHHLFNVVTNTENNADAVLIRAIEPVDGIALIKKRRNRDVNTPELTAGPGRLTEALGITIDHYGTDLTGDTIWIEHADSEISDADIQKSNRIGVEYAGEHARRPWRFTVKGNRWVSR